MTENFKVRIAISLDDAETLQSLIRGSMEGADDDEFVAFAERVLKLLDKSVQKFYPDEKRHFIKLDPSIMEL